MGHGRVMGGLEHGVCCSAACTPGWPESNLPRAHCMLISTTRSPASDFAWALTVAFMQALGPARVRRPSAPRRAFGGGTAARALGPGWQTGAGAHSCWRHGPVRGAVKEELTFGAAVLASGRGSAFTAQTLRGAAILATYEDRCRFCCSPNRCSRSPLPMALQRDAPGQLISLLIEACVAERKPQGGVSEAAPGELPPAATAAEQGQTAVLEQLLRWGPTLEWGVVPAVAAAGRASGAQRKGKGAARATTASAAQQRSTLLYHAVAAGREHEALLVLEHTQRHLGSPALVAAYLNLFCGATGGGATVLYRQADRVLAAGLLRYCARDFIKGLHLTVLARTVVFKCALFCQLGHEPCLSGAPPNVPFLLCCSATDKMPHSPLIRRLLLAGADPSAQCKRSTAVHLAVQRGWVVGLATDDRGFRQGGVAGSVA